MLVVKVVLFSHVSRSSELVRWKNKVQCCLSTQIPTRIFAGERWGREISAGIDRCGFKFQCYLHGGKSRNQRERESTLYITNGICILLQHFYDSILLNRARREIQQVLNVVKLRISLYGSFLPQHNDQLCFLQWNYFSPLGNYDARNWVTIMIMQR